MVLSASEQPSWKEFKLLSAENRELWVRAYIADDLYEEFFRKKRMIFGFDDGRDVAMRDFESTLLESGKGQSSFSQSIVFLFTVHWICLKRFYYSE